ncbi:hypothetical protein Tco_0955240 [Tanacetum coccineum]|uniref:Uncharacterized protein n=1 Tax=Tanacetum coccineum TaxID=301880 RepID=A0ABQ5E6N5_9ASTR
MNSDTEDDIMDPVMQCTTLPSYSSFSQQKLVSFVTEIHTTSIDFLTPIHKLLTRVLRSILVIVPEHPSDNYVFTMKMEILLEPASNKLLDSYKDGYGDASFQLESDSLQHAHAQTTKTYQVYQGRLLASFQDDEKYEHVGQDTRSQGCKDDQDGRIKIERSRTLRRSLKTMSKAQDQRSQSIKEQAYNVDRDKDHKSLTTKAIYIDLIKVCHNELTSAKIVSLKILSRTRKFVH